MTPKPTQHSVAIVTAIRTSINGTIDAMLGALSVQSEQLEQAFLTELGHLDETYTDQENDDTALELVQRFDKGYAKTMASIQAATERLVEARAHIARITNTIEFHPAFTGNGCNHPYPVANADATINRSITGTLDRDVVSMRGVTPVKTSAIEGHTVEYNPIPTKENDHE